MGALIITYTILGAPTVGSARLDSGSDLGLEAKARLGDGGGGGGGIGCCGLGFRSLVGGGW